MWEGYINAIDEFIDEHDDVTASPVVDRFHVAQNYRDDFDDLRKKELRRLKKELPSETYDEECKGMLWTLRLHQRWLAAVSSAIVRVLVSILVHPVHPLSLIRPLSMVP